MQSSTVTFLYNDQSFIIKYQLNSNILEVVSPTESVIFHEAKHIHLCDIHLGINHLYPTEIRELGISFMFIENMIINKLLGHLSYTPGFDNIIFRVKVGSIDLILETGKIMNFPLK